MKDLSRAPTDRILRTRGAASKLALASLLWKVAPRRLKRLAVALAAVALLTAVGLISLIAVLIIELV